MPGLFVVIICLYGIYKIKFFSELNSNIYLKYFIVLSILFYLYLVINSLFSISPSESLKSSLFYFRFIFFALGSYFIIIKYRSSIMGLVTKTTLIAFVILFVSIVIELFITTLFLNNEDDQFTGIFFEEQIAGSFISKFYPFLLGLLLISKSKIFNFSKYILITLIFNFSLLIVLLSGERTALAVFIISNVLIFIGVKDYRRLIFGKLQIFFSLIIIIFFSLFAKDTLERLIHKTKIQLYDNEKLNLYSPHHESHYITAFNMFNQNKVFGVGPRLFRVLCDDEKYIYIYKSEIQYDNDLEPKYIDGKLFVRDYNGCSTHPHNIIIQIMAETGALGLCFYLLFLIFIFLQLFTHFRVGIKENDIIKFTILTSLFSSLFPILPSNNFFGSYINIFYFFIIAFYFAEKKNAS